MENQELANDVKALPDGRAIGRVVGKVTVYVLDAKGQSFTGSPAIEDSHVEALSDRFMNA